MDVNRVYAGSILFCLLVSVGLYYLPRWRRLPRKTVKVMAKIFQPASKVFSAISGIAFVGSLLLTVFDYPKPAARLMLGAMVMVFVFVLPAWVGYFEADREATKREQAERREKEKLAGG